MFGVIETIELAESSRGFIIVDVIVRGNSLIDKAKNKNLVINFLKNIKSLKTRGKSNQIQEYLKLEEYGIRLKFPPKYQREILLTKLLD